MEESNELEQQPSFESTTKVKKENTTQKTIVTEGVTPVHDMGGGYVEYNNALFQKDALKELKPELFRVKVDISKGQTSRNFGTNFPNIAAKGDIFVRVDTLPNRVFKFDGRKWIEINKEITVSYLYDQEYIKYIVQKIESGEYDVDLLSDNEKEQIEEYLKGNQNS